jgi:hypothetical protein
MPTGAWQQQAATSRRDCRCCMLTLLCSCTVLACVVQCKLQGSNTHQGLHTLDASSPLATQHSVQVPHAATADLCCVASLAALLLLLPAAGPLCECAGCC